MIQAIEKSESCASVLDSQGTKSLYSYLAILRGSEPLQSMD